MNIQANSEKIEKAIIELERKYAELEKKIKAIAKQKREGK